MAEKISEAERERAIVASREALPEESSRTPGPPKGNPFSRAAPSAAKIAALDKTVPEVDPIPTTSSPVDISGAWERFLDHMSAKDLSQKLLLNLPVEERLSLVKEVPELVRCPYARAFVLSSWQQAAQEDYMSADKTAADIIAKTRREDLDSRRYAWFGTRRDLAAEYQEAKKGSLEEARANFTDMALAREIPIETAMVAQILLFLPQEEHYALANLILRHPPARVILHWNALVAVANGEENFWQLYGNKILSLGAPLFAAQLAAPVQPRHRDAADIANARVFAHCEDNSGVTGGSATSSSEPGSVSEAFRSPRRSRGLTKGSAQGGELIMPALDAQGTQIARVDATIIETEVNNRQGQQTGFNSEVSSRIQGLQATVDVLARQVAQARPVTTSAPRSARPQRTTKTTPSARIPDAEWARMTPIAKKAAAESRTHFRGGDFPQEE